jgi:hypothetical protein
MGRKALSKLWEILVPRCSNDGKEYDIEHHRVWDEKVRDIAGGITILRTARGQWFNPEKRLFVEEMIPVRIYCNEKSIDKIIDYTLQYYDQEAVLAYEVSSNVKIRHRKQKN